MEKHGIAPKKLAQYGQAIVAMNSLFFRNIGPPQNQQWTAGMDPIDLQIQKFRMAPHFVEYEGRAFAYQRKGKEVLGRLRLVNALNLRQIQESF